MGLSLRITVRTLLAGLVLLAEQVCCNIIMLPLLTQQSAYRAFINRATQSQAALIQRDLAVPVDAYPPSLTTP